MSLATHKTIINMRNTHLMTVVVMAFLSLTACNHQSQKEANSTQPQANEIKDMHQSKNSLDWEGVYEGTLPCASCEGIQSTVTLKADLSFEKKEVYLGEKNGTFNEKGKFSWDKDGSIITLKLNDEKTQYRVKEGCIVMLNADGKENTGELAEHYILRKIK